MKKLLALLLTLTALFAFAAMASADAPVCPDCGSSNYSSWANASASQHSRYCLDCGSAASYQYAGHAITTAADCTQRAYCEVCSSYYGEPDKSVHNGMTVWKPDDSGSQHYRYCAYCQDASSYEYGSHRHNTNLAGIFCTQDVTCLDCGAWVASGRMHPSYSDWEKVSATQHSRYCLNCSVVITTEHTGGDSSCTPICEGCGAEYVVPDGQHNLSGWVPATNNQHLRYCLDCRGSHTYEYADHFGGDGSCIPVCEGCGYQHIDTNGVHNAITAWAFHDDAQHSRYCTDCSHTTSYQYEAHTGGTATCIVPRLCSVCNTLYGTVDANAHTWGPWQSNGDNTHTRICQLDPSHTETVACSGGKATCVALAVCEYCSTEYGAVDPDADAWGPWTRVDDTTHSRTCTLCQEVETGTHHGGDGTCLPVCSDCSTVYLDIKGEHTAISTWLDAKDDVYHYRYCLACRDSSSYEYEEHTGGTATCAQSRVCEVCSTSYGEPDPEAHPNPTLEELEPACLEDGYQHIICDEPGCLQPFTEIILPSRGQHVYLDWQPIGDGTHTCACHYCGEELTVPCTRFESVAPFFSVCPFCGEYEGGVLPVLYCVEEDACLPYGSLILRCGEIPVEGVLYAITLTGSYDGVVVDLIIPYTILAELQLENFRIVDMHGDDVPFRMEHGNLILTVDKVNLFLIMPME